jgi:HK97 family phage major capsid protein
MNLSQTEIAEIHRLTGEMKAGFFASKESLKTLNAQLDDATSEQHDIAEHAARIRRQYAATGATRQRGAVTDDFARYLAAVTILGALNLGRQLNLSPAKRDNVRRLCRQILLPVMQRTAITTGDVPLPVAYSGELVSLVESFGKARKYGTTHRLTRGTNKLPRLSSSPAFGFMDMAATVPEKVPQIAFVNLNGEKAGGIIRFPSEIDQDSIVELGQFIATYAAREMARWEDTVFFTADGSVTYKSFKGVTKAALDNSRKVTLTAGLAAPSEIVLADLRALRTKVASAALIKGA